MTNNLSQIPDAELNAVFAKEVAGWKPERKMGPFRPGHVTPIIDGFVRTDGTFAPLKTITFSTSMDALMPWLEEVRRASSVDIESTPDGKWLVSIYLPHQKDAQGLAAMLPRATAECLVLLKRASKPFHK